MTFLLVIGSIILAWVLWTSLALLKNYRVASRIGLPIIVSPVSTLNPFWIISYRVFPAILSLKKLPFGLGTWIRCTPMGWAFQDKHAIHDELGPIFTIVTPAGNELTVADPSVAHLVLARRKEYVKPAIMYGMMAAPLDREVIFNSR